MGKVAHDDYPTQQPLADAMTRFLYQLFPDKQLIIEPSCGAGNFIRIAKQLWTGGHHLGIDIFEHYRVSVEALGATFALGDFLSMVPILGANGWLTSKTVVYGNPPYSQDYPQRFIEAVSQHAQPGCHIAFLLRQSFLGGINRALDFKERKSLRIKRDVAGRPKFDVNSKSQDNSEYGVFIYEVGYRGHYLGWEDPLIWKPKHLAKLAKEAA